MIELSFVLRSSQVYCSVYGTYKSNYSFPQSHWLNPVMQRGRGVWSLLGHLLHRNHFELCKSNGLVIDWQNGWLWFTPCNLSCSQHTCDWILPCTVICLALCSTGVVTINCWTGIDDLQLQLHKAVNVLYRMLGWSLANCVAILSDWNPTSLLQSNHVLTITCIKKKAILGCLYSLDWTTGLQSVRSRLGRILPPAL